MFRALGNILIIFIICIIATGISINFCPVTDIDSSVFDENITDITLVTNDESEQLFNPETITVKYKANSDITMSFAEDYLLKATIYRDDEIYETHYMHEISNDKPLIVELTKDTPYSVLVDISQSKLRLPNGNYSISIAPNMSESEYSVAPLTLNIDYMSDVPYIPSTNNVPEKKIPYTLYFSDTENSIEQLIGITRFVDSNNKSITTLIDELRKGPSLQLGLNMSPHIGSYNYISVKNSIAYIDLPSSEKLYTEDSVKSEVAMNSFIRSVSNFTDVDKIKFLVDYNKADIFFNGKTITNTIEVSSNDKAYLAFNTSSRYFLVDCSIESLSEESTIQEKVTTIFKTLKEGSYYGLSNTIPEGINLLDYKIDNNTLLLNLSSDFINAHGNNENLQRLMLDSILYSFTSIEGIDYVSITMNAQPINNFAGIDLSSPIPRPMYINPETGIR